MDPRDPRSIRYIKLGENGRWAKHCFAGGTLQVRYLAVDHQLALSGDRNCIRAAFIASGEDAGTATRLTNELLAFYQLPQDCLWFTMANDRLWWCFAEPEVTWIGGDGRENGARERRAIGGWRSTSIGGAPLSTTSLSTAFSRICRTQCTIANGEPYREMLLRLINDQSDPLQARMKAINSELRSITERALRQLHQEDLETLADLILARSGWHRTSRLGGSLAKIDLAVEQVGTGERAFVQVKSIANQATFKRVLADYEASRGYDRMIFVCHSSANPLKVDHRPDIEIWTGSELADRALRAGLFSWITDRVG